MIELGALIVAVKEILGRSSLDMTMRYAHPNESLGTTLEGLNYIVEPSTNETSELQS